MLQSELEINKKYAKTKGMKIVNSQMYTHDWAQKGLAMTKKNKKILLRLYIDYIDIQFSQSCLQTFSDMPK